MTVFSVAGPIIWNQLLITNKYSETISTFRKISKHACLLACFLTYSENVIVEDLCELLFRRFDELYTI